MKNMNNNEFESMKNTVIHFENTSLIGFRLKTLPKIEIQLLPSQHLRIAHSHPLQIQLNFRNIVILRSSNPKEMIFSNKALTMKLQAHILK